MGIKQFTFLKGSKNEILAIIQLFPAVNFELQ